MKMQLANLFKTTRPFSIRSIDFPATSKVLVLGPHPDDFDAVGVTMRIFQHNDNAIYVAVVRTGSGVEDAYCSPATLEAKAALREEEQRQSCRFFGLADECLTFLDMEQDDAAQPIDTPVNLDTLKNYVLQRRPDLVFLPHGNDTNSGHRIVYALFQRMAREAGYPVVAFLSKDPKTIAMRIDAFTAYEDAEARWKGQLLRFHGSQQQRNLNTRNHGFDERILAVDRQTAQELGIAQPYAEAFELEFYDPSGTPHA